MNNPTRQDRAAQSPAIKARPQRRQWGAESSFEPLPPLPVKPTTTEIAFGRFLIVVVVLGWTLYLVSTVVRNFLDSGSLGFRYTMEAVLYFVLVTALAFSALMYLIARQGALSRFREHSRVPRGVLDEHFAKADPNHSITVLIPSYKEEPNVVRNTIWSAALQEFPNKRVVLLIDDPPNPTDAEDIRILEEARGLAYEIQHELNTPFLRAQSALDDYDEFYSAGKDPSAKALSELIESYKDAVDWLETKADHHVLHDHMDHFFANQVLLGLASELRLIVIALTAAQEQRQSPTRRRIRQLHVRLVWIFGCRIETFERKKYVSLSQEANKAMNLNSYIGLMGESILERVTAAGTELVPRPATEGGRITFPDSTYILTLDADSMLLREYCLRLVYYMEEVGNDRVAVAQTPYSSYRGVRTRVERIAGATTDVQHILHQGMTRYHASFWVGANAVIRKEALHDLREVQMVNGHQICTFIQDRTVIEDTESSIDLGTHGWSIFNYPERLSYSATPPDFGSLIVQRRRWANGGLLILPKFRNQVRHRKRNNDYPKFQEKALRFNYMASLAWANIGLAFLLVYPFDHRLLSLWVLAIGVPYFIAMGLDLRQSGHRFSDIFRIYGLNLIMIAVNLAGVFKSLQQAFTGEKIPFARTPKVADRTAAQPMFVLVPYLIVLGSLIIFWRDYSAENWGNAIFAGFNVVVASWAIIAYIGFKNSIVDLVLGSLSWIMVDKKPSRAERNKHKVQKVAHQKTETSWQEILYYGDRRMRRDVKRKADLRRRRET